MIVPSRGLVGRNKWGRTGGWSHKPSYRASATFSSLSSYRALLFCGITLKAPWSRAGPFSQCDKRTPMDGWALRWAHRGRAYDPVRIPPASGPDQAPPLRDEAVSITRGRPARPPLAPGPSTSSVWYRCCWPPRRLTGRDHTWWRPSFLDI